MAFFVNAYATFDAYINQVTSIPFLTNKYGQFLVIMLFFFVVVVGHGGDER